MSDNDVHVGDTVIVGQQQELLRIRGRETFVVTGAARGGTSVLSYVLYNAGLFIGERLGKFNHEDQDVLELSRDESSFIARFKNVIERRNAAHRQWGFKLPSATSSLVKALPHLRNPVLVIAVRNPLATLRTIHKRDPAFFTFADMISYAEQANSSLSLVRDTLCPFVLVDIDAARTAPQLFLEEFTQALGLTIADYASVTQSLMAGGYAVSQPSQGSYFVEGGA